MPYRPTQRASWTDPHDGCSADRGG